MIDYKRLFYRTTYYVYVVRCHDKHHSLYTGITNNLRKRIEQHNGLRRGGAKFTRSRRPVFFAYIEKCPNRIEAMKREHEIKKLHKEEKEELVKSITKEQILAAL